MDTLILNYPPPYSLSEDKWLSDPFSPSGEPIPIVKVVTIPEPCLDVPILYGGHTRTIRIRTSGTVEAQCYLVNDFEVIAPHATDDAPVDLSLPAKLDLIRMQFGIGTKHLAEALGVERPTVYSWQNAESKPQDKRWDRIRTLVELANYWSSLSEHSLGRQVFEPVVTGGSVMDMLKEEVLDADHIKTVLRNWAASHIATKARLRQKAVTIRDGMASRGFKPLPDEVIDQTLRELANPSR